jgi:dynein heavy chain, axonemal
VQASISAIFGAILGGFLGSRFPAAVGARLLGPMVAATAEMYERVVRELLPTPDRSHYLFSLQDVARVFQGILRASPPKQV